MFVLLVHLDTVSWNLLITLFQRHFDNTIKAHLAAPALTTVNIDKKTFGRQVIFTLIERIKEPKTNNKIIYLTTDVICHDITNRAYKK